MRECNLMKADFSTLPVQIKIQTSKCQTVPGRSKPGPMQQRFNVVTSAIFLTLSLLSTSALARDITLKNESWVIAFDSNSGALTRLESKSPQWAIEGRSKPGASFWLNAQSTDGRQDNIVLGQKQKPVEVKKLSSH